jgi:hypothetical protein
MATEGDLVLVHVEHSPAFFARIECISPDVKPEWHQVNLLVLQVPLIEVTWILHEAYINGASFTMGGKKVLLEVVQAPGKKPPPAENRKSREQCRKQPCEKEEDKGKVISLFDRG